MQAARLEQAMIAGRRWPLADFERVLVGHPVLRHLARLLVWGAWEAGDAPAVTFRLTDEGDLADEADRPVTLDRAPLVGVAHPVHLGRALAAWTEIVADYQLVQPFPQVARPVYAIGPDQREARAITAFAGIQVPAPALIGTLERRGWTPGAYESGSRTAEHRRGFPAAGLTAVARYQELDVSVPYEETSRSVQHCHFVRGTDGEGGPIRLGEADPIAASEVLADLHAVAEHRR